MSPADPTVTVRVDASQVLNALDRALAQFAQIEADHQARVAAINRQQRLMWLVIAAPWLALGIWAVCR